MRKTNFLLAETDEGLKQSLETAIQNALAILKRDMQKYIAGNVYPAAYTDEAYQVAPMADLRNHVWEEGFWTGQLWLAYELTGEADFRELAEKNVVDFAKRMDDNMQIDWHHDTGFLYTPSCVAAYKLTGNRLAKQAAEEAAYSLSRRFRVRGEFIQSMGYEMEPENYKFIIDTMLNIPLLFWATEETGKRSYRDKAIRHAETTRKYVIREDGSTYHHFLMNFETAGPKGGLTWQGSGDNSCWSRGHAWMIYGSALMYTYTGDASWIQTFETITDYFIAHLPANGIPSWDFSAMGTEDDATDTSAGVIAACGIMELANYLPADQGKMPTYLETARKIMSSAISTYAVKPTDGCEGLIKGVMPAKPQGYCEPCAPYGDYFYLEALMRAARHWERYW